MMYLMYLCDNSRHLICLPYSVENLHEMAKVLKIKKCWFHYDIPFRRVAEIQSKCLVVSSKRIFNIVEMSTLELEDTITGVETGTGLGNRVILFNCDCHTFDEVINQLIKVINCSRSKAEAYAMEVHTKGKAAVFEGEIHECLRVSHGLESIGLVTQIEV